MKFASVINAVCLPVRLALPHETVNRMGLQSMRDERCAAVLRWCTGKILDIGCGNNQLVRAYGNGVGVDVYDFGGGATIVQDTAHLPFPDASFDTVCFVASLNHIPNRAAVITEAHRLLRPGGRAIATMLTPVIGIVRHKLAWWDEDQHERGMKEGEMMGMEPAFVQTLFLERGFRLVAHRKMTLGLNNLFVFESVG